MPRRARTVIPGFPHHVTQRGYERRQVFFTPEDYRRYLRFLCEHSRRDGVQVVAFCLMPNHVHLILIPETESALAIAVGNLHLAYTRYFNGRYARTVRLWQSRFFSSPLNPGHLGAAMVNIERNPARASLVQHAWDYVWSSAHDHVHGVNRFGLLDIEFWRRTFSDADWRGWLTPAGTATDFSHEDRRATAGGENR